MELEQGSHGGGGFGLCKPQRQRRIRTTAGRLKRERSTRGEKEKRKRGAAWWWSWSDDWTRRARGGRLDPTWIGHGAACGRAREDGASLGTRRRCTARRAPGVEEAGRSGTTPEAEQLGVVQSFGERGHGRACSGRRMVVGCYDLGYAENQGGCRRLVGGRWIGMDGGWLGEEAEEETRWAGDGGRNGWMG